MRKKILTIIAVAILTVVLAVSFSACNKFKWNTVPGGNPDADVLSNGGYVVEQGGYVYFINGYDSSTDIDNTFGNVYKQGIMRATVAEDGSVDADSYALVVPKQIYSSDSNSGFAIFGDWIYYATPNNEKDKTGTASTINMDFMRTKIDGSVTQVIFTIASRSYPYIFTPTCVLYYADSTIYSINFSGMKTDKNITAGSGAYRFELASGVTSYSWNYDKTYSVSQGAVASDYVLYTTATTDETQSYRNCNELNIIKADGSDKRTIVKFDTYATDYKIALLASVAESDTTCTFYYTKTKLIGSDSVVDGVFCNKFTVGDEFAFTIDTEKQLTAKTQSKITPINYELGALTVDATDSYVYYLNGTAGTAQTYSRKVIGRTDVSMQFVENVGGSWYVYYVNSSSAKTLYRINLISGEGSNENEAAVVSDGTIKTDWTKVDYIKSNGRVDYFYFDTDDYNYLHRANISAFDGNNVIDETELFGSMTETDATAKAAAEEAAAD